MNSSGSYSADARWSSSAARPGRTRKLIVATIMSLDGYVESPGGNVMAMPMDDFFDAHNLERLRAADTLLLGATTYRDHHHRATGQDAPGPPPAAGDGRPRSGLGASRGGSQQLP